MRFLQYFLFVFYLIFTPLFSNEFFSCYGELYSANMQIKHPENIEQIQAIIKSAKTSGKKIAVLGAGLSQGKHFLLPDAILIDMKKINHVHVNRETVTVGAGARWHEVQQVVNKHGRSLLVMQGSNIFSVGGSLSANCHGWDFRSGHIINIVSEIKIVNAQGEVIRLTKNDPLFDYVIGGYGCFGIIIEATINLTKNVTIHESPLEINLENYVEYFQQKVLSDKKIAMHRYRLSVDPKNMFKNGVVTNYEILDSKAQISNLKSDPSLERRVRRYSWIIRKFPSTKRCILSLGKRVLVKDKITTRNEVMAPPAQVHFEKQKETADWLQEFFIPPEHFTSFLNYLAQVLVENKVNVMSATVRYVKSHKAALSYAPNKDCFSIVIFFNQSLEKKKVDQTRIWVQQVINDLISREGTYYLPYQHFASLEQFHASYPKWEDFKKMKLQVDPECLFLNDFYQDYFNNEISSPSQLREVFDRKKGLRYEIGDFIDHILMNVSKRKFFILMDRILSDKHLSDDEIYQEMLIRISEARGNRLGTLKRKYLSLSKLQNDLTALLKYYLPQKNYLGYVEIGYPGRMIKPLKKIRRIKGPIYVVSNYESHLEAGIFFPYKKKFPLKNFAPLTNYINANSVDLVSCFMGLHHIHEENLDDFVHSISEILNPGGIFILMDHDVGNEKMEKLVHTIHTIYNASMGIDLGTNNGEIRNFYSKNCLIELLKKYGLVYLDHPPLIRKGDPTKNEILLFKKL